MNKATSNAALLSVSLDRGLKEPLQNQLVRQLRRIILERAIAPGDKLPSSRALAEELSVSRVTVTAAIDQLISEGYLVGRKGSGVYVEEDLPDYEFSTSTFKASTRKFAHDPSQQATAFEVGLPDLSRFPYRVWSKFHDRVWRVPDQSLLGKVDPFGWPPLREAISHHLKEWRGITCHPEQIIVTTGITNAIDLISQTALNKGDTVFVEEPGYDVVRMALIRNNLMYQSSRVDELGFDIVRADQEFPGASAAVVTPSRQFPLGMVLPLARRLELLDWAATNNSFVIEDDFDSEYRYQGQPLPALMSLSGGDRVIYVGSFSKVLFPGLRLGFVVLPRRLRDRARLAVSEIGSSVSLMQQPVLARFMEEGEFATHIRRMRRLYTRRQKAMIGAVLKHANDLFEVEPSSAGMHLIAKFRPTLSSQMTDKEVSVLAKNKGIVVRPLSSYFVGSQSAQGLVLGFAGFDERLIDGGIRSLAQVIKSHSSK